MESSCFKTPKRQAVRGAVALSASMVLAAAALPSAFAGQLPLVDWNQAGAPPATGTSSSLQSCPATAPAGNPGGQKGRSAGMYQFIKYGAAPIQLPTLTTWQAAANCVAGILPPPPVITESESASADSGTPAPAPITGTPPAPNKPPTASPPPSPPPPPTSGDTGPIVESNVLVLAGTPAEVPQEPAASATSGDRHAVPEPTSALLLGAGLLAIWGARRRRPAAGAL